MMNEERLWTVYLAGEIHSDWREKIQALAEEAELPVEFTGPVTDHSASDACGAAILGEEQSEFWKDLKGARLNAIRTRTLLLEADIVVVRFGGEYRQWNSAFDAGYAHAHEKPLIVLHDGDLGHALKEIDAAAHAVAQTPEQVVRVLQYVISAEL